MQITYYQKPVILIEFREGKVCNLLNSEGEIFCFDWSEKLQMYLVSSGAFDSISGECWVSESHQNSIKEKFPDVINISLPISVKEIQIHLDESYPSEDTIYCKICETSYDKDNFYHKHGGDYCVHINWNDELGEFAGCGYSEDNWEDYKESFFKLLDIIKEDVPALKNSLSIHKYFFEIVKGYANEYSIFAALLNPGQTDIKECLWYKSVWRFDDRKQTHRHWEDLHKIPEIIRAILWIDSLWSFDRFGDVCDEVPTTLADEITVKWIEEWEAIAE